MIQFKRGSKQTWGDYKLGDGQPGYDRTRKKLKVGDGKTVWSALPYVSGLFTEEIIDSVSDASRRYDTNHDDLTLITYDTKSPSEHAGLAEYSTIYLQQYEAAPEVDYVTDISGSTYWVCQKWRSGFVRCTGTFTVDKPVSSTIESCNLYSANKVVSKKSYPVTFKDRPHESATLRSSGGVAWLASVGTNSTSATGAYSIIGTDKLESATYDITITAEGFIDT